MVEYRELYKVRALCRNRCGYAMLSGRFLAPDLAISHFEGILQKHRLTVIGQLTSCSVADGLANDLFVFGFRAVYTEDENVVTHLSTNVRSTLSVNLYKESCLRFKSLLVVTMQKQHSGILSFLVESANRHTGGTD